jgi:hypothetical protein
MSLDNRKPSRRHQKDPSKAGKKERHRERFIIALIEGDRISLDGEVGNEILEEGGVRDVGSGGYSGNYTSLMKNSLRQRHPLTISSAFVS